MTLPDQAARDAISRDTNLSMMVEAGAGSGKTTSLAARMVATLRSGAAEVQQMAAITFTRKAAGELRGRFQTALEAAHRDEQDPEAKKRLGRALKRLELLFTGTLHAFCARLLRERPVEARIPPGFQELEPDEDEVLRNRALDSALADLHSTGDPALAELAAAGADPGELREAFRVLCAYDEVDFPSSEREAPDPARALQRFLAFWEGWQERLPSPIPPDATCPYLIHARELLELRLRPDLRSDPAALAGFLEEFQVREKATQKNWKPKSWEEGKAMYDAFAEGPAAEYLNAWRGHLYALALPVLLEARRRVRQARRREGKLNYQDLLLLAAELLRDNAEVRGFFQDRFRCLFVDEFQDTDPVQAEVMAFLASSDRKGKDWTKLPLRPGALFVVGDPKQSIYRFRRADLAVFRKMRERIEASGGRTVTLSSNFRSGKGILSWLDTAFAGLFPAQETEEQPPHRPLEPGKDIRGRVMKLTVQGGVNGAHLEDASAISRYIRAEVDAGRRTPEDFLILTPNTKHLVGYASALEALSIPYEASGGSAFSETPEVRHLSALASSLGDPDDAVALVGVLRGPLFGLSDEDLYLHHKAGGAYRFLGASKAGQEIVRRALARMEGFHALTRTLPPAAALEALLEETGLLALAASGKGAALAGGGLFTALERARARAEAGAGFPEIALALEADLESGTLEASPLEPGRSGVVRLMNLHKAKGLEAPVVFLADPMAPLLKPPKVRVLREKGGAEGFLLLENRYSEFGRELLAAPADWEAHAEKEGLHLAAEADRLRYVAATRAMELLVVSRYGGKPGVKVEAGAWRPFEAYLTDVEELEVPKGVPVPARNTPDLSAKARESAALDRKARLARSVAPSFAVTSVTRLVEHAPTMGAAEPVPEGEAGPEWGVLIHGLLEAAMRSPSPPSLEPMAKVLAGENLALAGLASRAAEVAKGVMASEVWKEARKASEFHAEVPFSRMREGAVLNGVIDLAYRVEGGWAIVDYKTDRVQDAAHHAPQLELYAEAWEALSGEKVVRAGVFFVRTGKVEWITGPKGS